MTGLLVAAVLAGCGSSVTAGVQSAGTSADQSTTGPADTTGSVATMAPTSTTRPTVPPASLTPGTVTMVVVEIEGDEPQTVSRPAGCDAAPGSPADLAAEQPLWLLFNPGHLRWRDAAGCPVRIDVISHIHGSSHCGWETAEYLTVADPLGQSIFGADQVLKATNLRFVWDPGGVLGGAVTPTVPVAELPSTAADTGYRADPADPDATAARAGEAPVQLWLTADQPPALYLVDGDEAQVWRAEPMLGMCN